MFPAAWLARYRYDTRAALKQMTCPVLILHSPDDEIIPFSHGQALLGAAREPKRLFELRGGHNDAADVSRQLYAREVGVFLQAFLGRSAGDPAEAARQPAWSAIRK